MRTPKEYVTNLQNGIITEQMLADCLYSVNKRAKNYRDAARYSQYDTVRQEMNKFYQYKEALLEYIDPICIHQQPIGRFRMRIYDYEEEYGSHPTRDRVWENEYYNYEDDRFVEFYDIEVGDERYLYFLYYEVGNRSFHTPISNPEQYGLPIVKINSDFQTYGADVADLISPQFVVKVIHCLQQRHCTIIIGDRTITIEGRGDGDLQDTIDKYSIPPTPAQTRYINEICQFYHIEQPEVHTRRQATKWIKTALDGRNFQKDKHEAKRLERHTAIYADYKDGMAMEDLEYKYHVKEATIRKSIRFMEKQTE